MAFPKQRLIKYWLLILVLLLLIPLLQSLDQKQPEPEALQTPEPTAEEKLTDDGHAFAVFPSIELTQKRLPLTPPPDELPIERWRTDNGAQVLFLPAPELPMVDIRLLFDAGSARDGALPGLAQLTNAMLAEGSKNLNADQIAAGFEALGAQFSTASYRDMGSLSLRSLSKAEQLQPALELLTQVLAEPAFAAQELDRIKQQIYTYLRYQQQQPDAQAHKAFFQALYGEHPYAHPSIGTPDSLAKIDPDALRQFHQRFYVANNLTIALVGQLGSEQAHRIAETISRAIPAGQTPAALAKVSAPEAQETHLDLPTEQTTVLVGALGIDRKDPNYPALYLANHILGGSGFSARLMQSLREERGLTYGVSSGFTPMHARGPFLISFKTRSDQVAPALELLHQELGRFAAEGPSEEELSNAKRNILGSYPLTIASNASLVGQLAAIGFYDLPSDQLQRFMEQINQLDRDQVRQAFADLMAKEALIQVTVGPQAQEVEADRG